jgi:hypothetical protein
MQSFCWHCGKELIRPSLNKDPFFTEITDPIGNIHKVHKGCADEAVLSFRASDYPDYEYDLDDEQFYNYGC